MRPIPEPPPCERHSLQKAMRLLKNPGRFQEITSHLRRLSAELLDETVPYSKQNQEQLQVLFDKAVATYPFLLMYERAWPVKAYIIRNLHTTAYYSRRRGKTPESSLGNKENESWISEFDMPVDRQGTEADLQILNTVENAQRGHRLPARSKATVSPISDVISNVTGTTQTLSATSASINESPSTSSGIGPSDSFAAFMQRHNSGLRDLVPIFINGGISDEQTFRSLLTWPITELEGFLKGDLGLNAYQYRLVRVALTDQDS